MSAYHDIKEAAEAAPPRRPGWERVIWVGCSARQSLTATYLQGLTPEASQRIIAGLPVRDVRSSDSMKGWAIRDLSPAARWHDLEGRPDSHPDFEKPTA